jgi:ribonuclease D
MTPDSDDAVPEEAALAPPATDEEPAAPPSPLLELRDGLPPLTETPPALADACRALAAATGPVAIDAERASGYRYSSRAYLIQLRREGAGTILIDPIGFESMQPLQDALGDTEWILHAATQDPRASTSSASSRPRCSTPSWRVGSWATRGWAWPRSSRRCSATG